MAMSTEAARLASHIILDAVSAPDDDGAGIGLAMERIADSGEIDTGSLLAAVFVLVDTTVSGVALGAGMDRADLLEQVRVQVDGAWSQ